MTGPACRSAGRLPGPPALPTRVNWWPTGPSRLPQILLPVEDLAPPWVADPAATVAYYTAFVGDSAGNWSNPVWVVARASGVTTPPAPEPESGFPDVPSEHPHAQAIGALLAQGIVSGFSSGTFGPDLPVTRAQFTKMVVLALGIKPSDDGAGLPPTFADVPAADGYPFVYVEAAAELNIVRGSGTGPDGSVLFGPDRSVTRVQLAQMLARAGGDKLDLPPPGIVEPFYDLPIVRRERGVVGVADGHRQRSRRHRLRSLEARHAGPSGRDALSSRDGVGGSTIAGVAGFVRLAGWALCRDEAPLTADG